jgi:hypothetical protein
VKLLAPIPNTTKIFFVLDATTSCIS